MSAVPSSDKDAVARLMRFLSVEGVTGQEKAIADEKVVEYDQTGKQAREM